MDDDKYRKVTSKYYDFNYPNMSQVFPKLSEYNQDLLYSLVEKSANGRYYFVYNVQEVFSKIDNDLIKAMVDNQWLREDGFQKIFIKEEFHPGCFESYTFLKKEYGFFNNSQLINELFTSRVKGKKEDCYARFIIWDNKSFNFLFQQGQRLDEKDINQKLLSHNYKETVLSLLCKTISPDLLSIFLPYLEDLTINENLKKLLEEKPEHEKILIPFIEKKHIESLLNQDLINNPINKNKYKL
jgi:hypothetical protein